jgi:hypothetical protein
MSFNSIDFHNFYQSKLFHGGYCKKILRLLYIRKHASEAPCSKQQHDYQLERIMKNQGQTR